MRENVERLGCEAVVSRWMHMVDFGEGLRAGRLEEKIRLALAEFSPAQGIAFVHCFTDYNNIRAKVQDHCLLEMWTVFALFYAQAECGLERGSGATWGFLSAAVDYLVQNTFYISLIVIKAVKNRLVSVNKAAFEGYVKSLQRFNYETGIPLIKTMKVNNELVTYNLRRACEGLAPRLHAAVERFTDARLNPNCEFAFEQSALEFFALLRKAEVPGRPRAPKPAEKPPAARAEEAEAPRPESPKQAAKARPNPLFEESPPNIYRAPKPPAPAEEAAAPAEPAAKPRPAEAARPAPNENFPRKCNRRYTLVLDLDETLIHFKNDAARPKFLIRPNAYNFLKAASKHYEIIIFTAAQKEYADWILDKIDSKNNIVYRLYREHCQMSKTSHLKDLGMLGRDLSKTIIVDNFAENFTLHKENGICIRSWYGDLTDNALFVLEKFLNAMAEAGPSDVRKFMKAHVENNPEKGFFRVY